MTYRKRSYALFILQLGLAGCAVSGLDGLTVKQKTQAHRVENYLNRPVALDGQFVQLGARTGDGAGKFFYQPGSLELDYQSPHKMTMKAKGKNLVLDDSQTGAVTHLSLARNPLGLLLHAPVRFDGEIRVTSVQTSPGTSQISLAEADNPSQGLLTLQFIDHDGRLQLSTLDGVDARQNHVVLHLYNISESPIGTGSDPKN